MPHQRRRIVGVIGGAEADDATLAVARALGSGIARRGWLLVCGGRTGVMEAASRGAAEEGGTVVGVLPGPDPDNANPWVTVPIATNMGKARNAIITQTADALVAVGGRHGTLSEIGLGLNMGKVVLSLGSWDVDGVRVVADVEAALAALDGILREAS